MNYDNLRNQKCVFIEYETNHSTGRIVMLETYYIKKAKKLNRLLKGATIRIYETRVFTWQDIDFVRKGNTYGC